MFYNSRGTQADKGTTMFYVNDAVYVTVDNRDRNTENEITIPGKIVGITGNITRVWLEEHPSNRSHEGDVTLSYQHINGAFYSALGDNQRVMITHL